MRISTSLRSLLAFALVATAGCSDSSHDDPSGPNPPGLKTKAQSFESDLPAGASQNGGRGAPPEAAADGAVSVNAGTSKAATPTSASSADAARAIVEADIIQQDGTHLYALSRVAGLSIVDISDAKNMKLLGRYRDLNGTPFEMYLKNGVVLAMYSGWGQYERQGDGYAWVQTSKVIALDVSNPAAINALGTFDVPGDINDSRIVGDVMYVVSHQGVGCWGCDQSSLTSVVSLNVKDPHTVSKVDQLKFNDDPNNSWNWSQRSITVTDQRMYVAGPDYGSNGPVGSTIQVVDISDPAGDLVQGATIAADGQINSRWQMNEYQGVLRVISQIPSWWSDNTASPSVQTFKVDSSQSISKLASTPLSIPNREQLNTVQFDGTRGYAVTSQITDPLFAIDLSDPAHPKQAGQVEVPGSLYYLAARGDRVIGLGYDQGNNAGAITVSNFDVSDLSAPKLLDRVNFGGDWAYLPEDQDRIQKAFKILDDQGLILVPFTGWNENKTQAGYYCESTYVGGAQLVDLNGDDLVLRGVAPSRGEARRAFTVDKTLLEVSDEAIESFDISNRDQPNGLGRLMLARYVTHALPLANGTVARINQDWYGKESSTVDFIDLADADHPELSLSELDISQLVNDSTACTAYGWITDAFVSGNVLTVDYQHYEYDVGDVYKPGQQTFGVLNIDVSNPSKPTVLSNFKDQTSTDQNSWNQFYNYYSYGYMTQQTNVLRTDKALVFLEEQSVPTSAKDQWGNTIYGINTRLRVLDLSNPASPAQTTLALPAADGYSGLVLDGSNIMISHYKGSSTGKARFYLDRVDLSNPSKPALGEPVNVPGALLHNDRANGRVLTSDLVRTTVTGITGTACYQRFAYADFTPDQTATPPVATADAGVGISTDAGASVSSGSGTTSKDNPSEPTGTCTGYTQHLQLVRFVDGGAVLDDTYALAEGERLSSSSLGDARVAAVVSRGWIGWWGGGYAVSDIAIGGTCIGCGPYYGPVASPVDVLTLGGFDTGTFTSGRLTVSSNATPWWGFWGTPPVYAAGSRALVLSQDDAATVDMSDPRKPSIVHTTPLYASYTTDMSESGSLVVLSLGEQGVQSINLNQ